MENEAKSPLEPPRVAGIARSIPAVPATVKQNEVEDEAKNISETARMTPPEVKYPARMKDGDVLHEVIEQGKHRVEIVEKKDPSQFIKFHGLCSCGVHGRFHEKADLLRYINAHLQRSENRH